MNTTLPQPTPQPHPHTHPSTPQHHPQHPTPSFSGVVETNYAVKSTHTRSGKKMMNQYIVMETLGKGMHGTVRRGIVSGSGEFVVSGTRPPVVLSRSWASVNVRPC